MHFSWKSLLSCQRLTSLLIRTPASSLPFFSVRPGIFYCCEQVKGNVRLCRSHTPQRPHVSVSVSFTTQRDVLMTHICKIIISETSFLLCFGFALRRVGIRKTSNTRGTVWSFASLTTSCTASGRSRTCDAGCDTFIRHKCLDIQAGPNEVEPTPR